MVTNVTSFDDTCVSHCIDDRSTEFEGARRDSINEFLANLIFCLFWVFVVFRSRNEKFHNDRTLVNSNSLDLRCVNTQNSGHPVNEGVDTTRSVELLKSPVEANRAHY